MIVRRRLVRFFALATTLAGGAVACNLILDNQIPQVLGADAAPSVQDGTAPGRDGATLPPAACGAAEGDWTPCSGSDRCAPASEPLLTDTRFTQLHRTQSGLLAFGNGRRFLVSDAPGTASGPAARELPFSTALTLTADREFVYALDFSDKLELRRYQLDSLVLDDAWSPEGLQYLRALAFDEFPVFVALGEGALLGFSHRFVRDEVSTIHILAQWKQVVSTTTTQAKFNGFASLGVVNGSYGMAQTAYVPGGEPPTTVQAFRLDRPDAAPVIGGGSQVWQPLYDGFDDAGVLETQFANVYFALSCESTFVMSTRVGKAPLLTRVAKPQPTTVDLSAVMQPTDGGAAPVTDAGQEVDNRYRGTVGRWTLATDRNALYVARTGETQEGNPAPVTAGEIFVFDYGSRLVARIQTPGMARQLAVTDCYLYWLEADGQLRRMVKPGSSCALRK